MKKSVLLTLTPPKIDKTVERTGRKRYTCN